MAGSNVQKKYDPYKDINGIYTEKQKWTAANNAGDTAGMSSAAEKAKQYYSNLYAVPEYKELADTLQKSDVKAAKMINDTYAKTGKSAFRPYVSNVLKGKYGMSDSDINKAISYDELTGEVSLGGINLGKPYSEVDGVSYWDNDVLDKAIGDYTSKTGKTVNTDTENKQMTSNLYNRYTDLLDKYSAESAFETDEGKAILDRYDSKGWDAGYNAAASGAASNGGNLDSFAAANAMRQQAALRQKGEETALLAHNQKIQNIKEILSNLGVEIQNQFDRSETAKNNQAARLESESSVTGYIPQEYKYKNNPYFTENGTKLANNDTDYMEIINEAQERLKTATNESERNALVKTIMDANDARNFKIQNVDGYRQYAGTMTSTPLEQNADMRNAEAERQNNLDILDKTNQNNIDQIAEQNKGNAAVAGIEAESALNQINASSKKVAEPALSAAQATAAVKNGELSPAVIEAYNYHYGTNYTVDNPPKPKSSNNSESWVNSNENNNSVKYKDKEYSDATISQSDLNGVLTTLETEGAEEASAKHYLPISNLAHNIQFVRDFVGSDELVKSIAVHYAEIAAEKDWNDGGAWQKWTRGDKKNVDRINAILDRYGLSMYKSTADEYVEIMGDTLTQK